MDPGATSDTGPVNNNNCQIFNKVSEMTTKRIPLTPWEHELCEAVFTRSLNTVVKILSKPDRNYSQTVLDDCLLDACGPSKGRHLDLVEDLLCSGASIKAVSTKGGLTPILIAVKNGDLLLFTFLLQKGADVNAVTTKGDSALTLSIRPNRSLDIITLLLQQNKIDANHKNHQGYTALMKAVELKDFEVMKLLIDDYRLHNSKTLTISEDSLDSDETIVKCFGQELFDVATKAVMVKVIKLLLHTEQGESLLMNAALRADVEMVKMLLESQFYNFHILYYPSVTWFLQLFFDTKKQKNLAIGDADIPVVQLLLENSAAVNLYGKRIWSFCNRLSGVPPLITAVESGSLGLVQLMCKYGAKLDVTTNYPYYKTPLDVAAESGKADILQFLLNKKDMVSEQNGEVTSKSSALHLCLKNEHVDCAEILLKHGYNIDIKKFLPLGASFKAVSGLIAVVIGDTDLLRFFVQRGADVNAVTAEGDSALTLSVRPNRSLDIIALLLQQRGIDKNYKNHQSYTALMKAVQLRDIEVMKLLIDDHKLNNSEMLTVSEDSLDSDETIIKCFGQELFDVARTAGMVKVIKLLLHIQQRESPLMEAALRADVEIVKLLLDSQFYNVHIDDSGDTTFLQNFFQTKKQKNLVVGHADIPVVQLLLENGAAVNAYYNRNTFLSFCKILSGVPPLITAVESGSLGLVQLMCEYGAKLDVKASFSSTTPLDLAAESGKADILQFLLNKKDMVSEQNGEVTSKSSALHLCLKNEHVDCAEILLKHGYNIDIKKFLPLGASIKAVSGLIAVVIGDTDLLRFFVRRGADVNAVTAEGDSALTLSVRPNRSLNIIEILLQQSGIDKNHKNHQGYTALMKAVEARDIEVMKLLIDDYKLHNSETLTISKDSLDSDETIVTCFGQELFDVATRASMVKVIKLLLYTKHGESPLIKAALRADVELVEILTDSQFYDVHKEDSGYTTILQNFFQTKKQKTFSIGDVDIPMIKLLIESGAKVNKPENRVTGAEPPLITAIKAGSLGLVQLMCEYGAKLIDVSTICSSKTPLEVAAESGKADILQFLLSKHAKVYGRGEDVTYKDSPLHLCLVNGHTNCAEILLTHGYQIDVPSAAEYAIEYNKPAYLKFLLKKCPSRARNFLYSTRQNGHKILMQKVRCNNMDIINNLVKVHRHMSDFLLSHAQSAAMVQLLVSNGASVNRRATTTGNPVLLTLIRSGKNETSVAQIVKILLEKGANVNDGNFEGVTPLIAAAQTWDSSDLLNTLLIHGADVHKRDCKGMTAFLYAVERNYTNNAKFLMQLKGNRIDDTELRNTSGSTALMLAAKHNNKSIIELLLDRKADVIAEDQNGDTVLTIVARYGDANTLKKILEKGSGVDHQNNSGYSALMYAAKNCLASSDVSNLDVLLLHGATVNIKDNSGNTALLHSVNQGNTETAKNLLDHEGNHRVDIDVQNTSGSTALILAVKKRDKAITDLLLARGANVNIEDNSGDTALTLATRVNDLDTVMKNIQRGANINHQNKEGYSALMIAARNHSEECIKALLSAGADVNVVSHGQEKKTAISFLFETKTWHNDSTVHLLMDSLFDKGASSSYLKPDALFDLIQSNQLRLVSKLISNGFGPVEISSEKYLHDSEKSVAFPVVSPFMFALLYSQPKLARYFEGNWFLSTSDIQLQAKHDLVKEILEQRSNKECVDILDEFCSQPMSLLKLSFVAVSSAIGCVPGREKRVEKLPLPSIIKDKLLFKKQEVQLDIPESATPSRESTSYIHAMNLLLGASRSSYLHDNYDYGGHYYGSDSDSYTYYDSDSYSYYGSDD